MIRADGSIRPPLQADDPRHGTRRGHEMGCRQACCHRAGALYEKQRRLNTVRGIVLAVPSLRAQRRIQALMAIGWTTTDIAHAAGWTHRNRVGQMLNGQKGNPSRWITQATFDTINKVYDELSMTIPELTGPRRRSRARALRLGYVPPLGWDDIDNDPTPAKAVERRLDTIAEWDHLRTSGESIHQAARQLGVSVEAIEKAAERAARKDVA